jgi:hypothetical protein
MTPSMQKLEIVNPYAHALCIVTFFGGQIKKSFIWNVYIVLIFFCFLSQVSVIRIIKLRPFKIIIITNTCTIHLNP